MANGTAAPIANSRNGNTRSVGVHPSHVACSSGQYPASQVPGVLTRIIAAMVRPRKTSSASRRWLVTWAAAERQRDVRPRRPREDLVFAREAVEEPAHDVHLTLVLLEGGPLGAQLA